MSIPNCVLITGAQVGLGLECARLLAEANVPKIYMACLDPVAGEQAKNALEAATGKTVAFQVVTFDLKDMKSISTMVDRIQEPIDSVVLNAGGMGGSNRLELTKHGVSNLAAVNLLGHVYLVDLLLKQKKLTGSVLLAGSEAARGVPMFGLPVPVLKSGSVEEMKTILNSSFFKGKCSEDSYGYTKLLGALWMSSMARKQARIRFLTMSPGGCSGTAMAKELPLWKRLLLSVAVPIMVWLGIMHTVKKGAQRYVDALVDHKNYRTGVFYASKRGVSGELVDQSEISKVVNSQELQENANMAIRAFLE